MKERPIIMTGESVRAILDGTKTQTRRVVKPQPHQSPSANWWFGDKFFASSIRLMGEMLADYCPYGQPGDRLWVKEPWRFMSWNWDDSEARIEYGDGTRHWCQTPEFDDDRWTEWLIKESDNWIKLPGVTFHEDEGDCGVYRIADESVIPWRSPMFMPRWASRITLEIVNVRAEQVQNITNEDATAEGVAMSEPRRRAGIPFYGANGKWFIFARDAYAEQWDIINAKRGYPWASNPWVWVVEFKQVTP